MNGNVALDELAKLLQKHELDCTERLLEEIASKYSLSDQEAKPVLKVSDDLSSDVICEGFDDVSLVIGAQPTARGRPSVFGAVRRQGAIPRQSQQHTSSRKTTI